MECHGWNIKQKSTQSLPGRALEHHGILWNNMEYHININSISARKGLGTPWNTMKYNGMSHKNQLNQCPHHGTQLNTLEHLAIPWNRLEYHGISWNTMEYPGILWNTMEYNGMPWNTMEYYGILWNTLGYL